MRKLFYLSALLFSLNISAQKVYDLDKTTPKTEIQIIGKAEKTKDKAQYKKVLYSVYRTEKGKLFIVYLNKKGNYSKKYILE